ncbi:Mercaptopyruvate sulfurtransferase/thiosulfate sulfurtransferase [Phytophthora cinnamomi]|uniref:Mercaptopyruvate sulfurtransferase/thiosulfate sulfurtransferase n=1 Tax=Phytophthora cinnamomi TaxID=4785 RepID=UPI0035598A4F|nr:Mercaptopyruvate sulfurtransferase/thiosulfate sulfurtransferase [Phytophthora cinnamomi]
MLSSLRLRSPLRRCAFSLRSPSVTREFSALVDATWVRNAQQSGEPELLLFDCNHPASYPRGHVPDAVPLPLAASLLKDSTPQATGVVSRELFADVLRALRVPAHATLVFYDDEMSLKATRMWWVFRHYGFPVEQLKVLDGGVKQWVAEDNEVEMGAADDREASSAAAIWMQPVDTQKLVGFNAVQSGIADASTQFVDARSLGEYWGEDANGNARAGHVPGAFNFNWMEGVDFTRNGKFKSKEELDKVFVDHFHLDKDKPVITYCQRGIRAAHTAFALEQVMGFKDVKIYEDSMLQYLNRDDSQVEQQK